MTGAAPADDLAVLAGVQGVLIEVLENRNAELSAQVADLSERLAKLERLVSRNSGNSGMPPSAGDLPGKVAPEPKPGRGDGKRRQGKRRGALGAHLAWSESPDDTKPLFPQGGCGCGRDLGEALDLGVAASHQVIDTPVVTATVTRYDEHMVQCRCGKVHVADPPAGAGEAGTVTYNAVRVGLSEVRRVPGANSKQKPGRCLLECLKNREDDVLRFTTDLRIPPTSNQAERDLRPSKTQQF